MSALGRLSQASLLGANMVVALRKETRRPSPLDDSPLVFARDRCFCRQKKKSVPQSHPKLKIDAWFLLLFTSVKLAARKQRLPRTSMFCCTSYLLPVETVCSSERAKDSFLLLSAPRAKREEISQQCKKNYLCISLHIWQLEQEFVDNMQDSIGGLDVAFYHRAGASHARVLQPNYKGFRALLKQDIEFRSEFGPHQKS